MEAPTLEQLDPATADLARRIQHALPQHHISDQDAIRAAREIDGSWTHDRADYQETYA